MSLFTRVACLMLALTASANAAPPPGPPPVTGVLNLNTASKAQIMLLPHVGEKRANAVVWLRKQKPFTSTAEVMKVKGIGRKTYRKLKAHLTVKGKTTLRKVQPPLKKDATTKKARRPLKASREVVQLRHALRLLPRL